MNDLSQQVLAVLAELAPRPATVGTVTRRLGGYPTVDGRDMRVCLDGLVTAGQAEYLSGTGNNRSYRIVEAQ